MAVSGIILYGFVIIHMVGNLQIFQGPDKLNTYAQLLQSLKPLVWTARIALLFAIGVHIVNGISLTLKNKAARPQKYHVNHTQVASITSRLMPQSGLVIFAFVVYHLLHFTIGVTDPDAFSKIDSLGRKDVYQMVVIGFSNPIVSASYIIAMALLCIHLSHGFFSLFQTLGLNARSMEPKLKLASNLLALGIFVGNSSIPTAILFKLIGV